MLKKITYFILLIIIFGCEEKAAKKNNVDDFLYKSICDTHRSNRSKDGVKGVNIIVNPKLLWA